MRRGFLPTLVSLLALGTVWAVASAVLPADTAAAPQVRKIVVFDPTIVNEPARDALIQAHGGVKVKDLSLIDGAAVLLPPGAVAALAKEAGVIRIDDDVVVEALGKPSGSSSPPPESLPWGIDRIDADLAWSTTTGTGIKVGIIDTGIDLNHPDLVANIAGGFNAISPLKTAEDDNGHGTHVAGSAAAVDNTIGVIGAAPTTSLYAIKVLDRRGSGFLSDVIEGLDWAVANGMQIINMSLGTSSNIQSFHDAVKRVQAAGIVQVAAAGNSGGSVGFPAAYPEVIAVSATDATDTITSWSSRGPEVDLAAPGASIFSTYKGDSYKTLSGTSMASPHVAGTAALVLAVPSRCDANLDGGCSPAEVQQRLEATAEDLGAAGRDNLYGAGLVDAEAAVR